MILLRTDGGGASFNDERLRLVEKMLRFRYRDELQEKILKIHDHKGDLRVYWFNWPLQEDFDFVKSVWESFGEPEIVHFVSHFEIIEHGL
jgi:hypothetical protein